MAENLRDTGYPQPQISILSFWSVKYPGTDQYHLMGGEVAFRDVEKLRRSSDLWDAVYHPTATELLPREWFLFREKDLWAVARMPLSDGNVWYNENPHDAASMAWLWEKKWKKQ